MSSRRESYFWQLLWIGEALRLVVVKTSFELVSPDRSSTAPRRQLAQHLDGCQLCESELVEMACDLPFTLFDLKVETPYVDSICCCVGRSGRVLFDSCQCASRFVRFACRRVRLRCCSKLRL